MMDDANKSTQRLIKPFQTVRNLQFIPNNAIRVEEFSCILSLVTEV
jgi:hypothetical protein